MNINDKAQIKRITQLINKTNQFNLTTKRYSESEVQKIIDNNQLFSLSLIGRFGDLGLIAVVIIKSCHIDSFPRSCRVLSRNVEKKILHLINCHTEFTTNYIKTTKNDQVTCFYNPFATNINTTNNGKIYQLSEEIDDIKYIQQV